MIRVLVELWPGGRASGREVLGEIGIANVTPYDNPARYVCVLTDFASGHATKRIVGAHQRESGWAALLAAALAAAPADEMSESSTVVAASIVALLERSHGRQ